MRAFFQRHPYLQIVSIALLYMTILFSLGKVFRDTDWYLDTLNVWIALGVGVLGTGFTAVLLYFRYNEPGHNANSEHQIL